MPLLLILDSLLHNALQTIKKPLEYSAKNDFANIERVRDLEKTVSTWVDRLIASDLSPAQQNELQQFKALFSQYDEQTTPTKIVIIQQALQILERLEPSPSQTAQASLKSEQQDTLQPQTITIPYSPSQKPSPTNQSRSPRTSSKQADDLATPMQFIKGVGPKRSQLFNRMGIHTVGEALFVFPRRYEDRRHIEKIRSLRPGESLKTVYGVVRTCGVTTTPKQRKKIFELMLGDETGILTAKWFNQDYLKRVFKPDLPVVLSGKITMNPYGCIEMIQPEYEILGDLETDTELLHTGRIVPIYPLTEGLYQKDMRHIMKSVVDQFAPVVEEDLPEEIQRKYRFLPLNDALRKMHFPDQTDDVGLLNREQSPAHQRLIFEEFFLLELGMGLKRQHTVAQEQGIAFQFEGQLEQHLRMLLSFHLTTAQERVSAEIQNDMRSSRPMNRLLQGDVGSGKTIVALIALLSAIEAGYQGAIMVPTEILAEQHFRKMVSYLDQLNARLEAKDAENPWDLGKPQGFKARINICLLTGGLKKKEREQYLLQIERGEMNLVVGTHALIQHDVTFHNLGLIVIDEQHKFGVMQRATLKAKGYHPDVLIMTATPIPRTLSLTVYGDLDVSILDELPPGRTPVITKRFYEQNREMAYHLIASEIEQGRQVYIVYPLVEESEKLDLKAATQMSEHLARDVFPQYRVGLIHGRMKPEEKDRRMTAFKNHELDILVSTTVLEVGIDVPNATVMLIEHAERFGLSQLHQLRGRVGRGSDKSYCLLMTTYPISDEGRKRLDAMIETTDGFVIAERDLEIRGPGEFFGTKQSGLPDLNIANLVRDVKLLECARKEAFALIARDPELNLPQHRPLKRALEQRWKKSLDLISVG
jgi:ATP-dependent DNA helicase RecG